jgi:hypothetical protein
MRVTTTKYMRSGTKLPSKSRARRGCRSPANTIGSTAVLGVSARHPTDGTFKLETVFRGLVWAWWASCLAFHKNALAGLRGPYT